MLNSDSNYSDALLCRFLNRNSERIRRSLLRESSITKTLYFIYRTFINLS